MFFIRRFSRVRPIGASSRTIKIRDFWNPGMPNVINKLKALPVPAIVPHQNWKHELLKLRICNGERFQRTNLFAKSWFKPKKTNEIICVSSFRSASHIL